MAGPTPPHPITLVRKRVQEAGLERLLVTPVADIAPRLFVFSRRGARLAERLGGDRPALLLSSAVAELASQVGESAAPRRGPSAGASRALPTVLVDRLAYALHALIDREAVRPTTTAVDFDAHAAPGPTPAALRPLLVAIDALLDRLARAGLDTSALPPLWRRRSRVTIDEGKGEGSIGAGFFFTDDPGAVPSGIFLDVSVSDDQTKPIAFVGVRGALPSVTAQWYAADRIKDVVMEPLFDEAPRLSRLAGGRFGALLAALDDLVIHDAERPHLAWVYAPNKALMLPSVRGPVTLNDAAAVELCKAASRGKVSAAKINDAVRAVSFATDADRAFAQAQAQRGRASGETLTLLFDHPFVVDDAGVALRVVGGRARVDVSDDDKVSLSAAGRPLDAAELQDGHAVALDASTRRLVVIEADAGERALARAIAQLGDARVPPAMRDAIAKRLKRSRVEVSLPAALRGEERAPSSSLVLLVACVRDGADPLGGGARLTVRARPIEGGPTLSPGDGPAVVFADAGQPRWTRRGLDNERQQATKLLRELATVIRSDDDDAGPFSLVAPTRTRALDAIAWAVARGDVEVAVADDVMRVARGRAEGLRVRFTEGTDWLGVEGDLAVGADERVSLRSLIEALREGRRYVIYDDARLVALDDDVRERVAGLAAFAGHAKDSGALRLPAAAASVVATDLHTSLDAASAGAIAGRMRALDDVDGEPSPRVQATMRPYQKEGLRFLRRLVGAGGGAVLADDMGLGKTMTAIALLDDRAGRGAQLVVAPTSLLHHWANELHRFAPALRPVVLADADGAKGRAALVDGAGPGDIVITSYGLAVRDVELLAKRSFETLLLDEAQAIKNAATARAKTLRRVAAHARVALTGTPLENHTGEVWSLLDLVCPGVFGTATQFRSRFAEPIEKDNDEARRALLARALRPFVLRRTKAQVAPELPPRIERTVTLSPTPEERAQYEQLRKAIVLDLKDSGVFDPHERSTDRAAPDPGQSRVRVLAAITRLRLMACHPALADDVLDVEGAPPATKHKALVALIDELRAEGHAALVFSQFVRHLRLAERYVRMAGARTLMLTGDTEAHERQRLVERFQAGEADAFFISLKAGGFGLNLTRATTVVHLDPWWNPAVEDQASDRAHRIGQTLPVTIVRLVMQDTIEAPILALHEQKRALADAVLEGSDAAARLSVSDLVALVQNVRLKTDDNAVVVVGDRGR